MSESSQIEPVADIAALQSTDQKRRRYARLFALACLVGLAVWGASVFKRVYPHDVKIQYVYKGLDSLSKLTQVHAALFVPKEAKPHAQITFFHHGKLSARDHRAQTLKLPKGKYPIYVTLRFANGVRKFRHVLQVHDSGTYYVKLHLAR